MYLETSARWIPNFGFSSKCATLLSTPVTKLSRANTSQPSEINRSHRCDPRKPAPPVTTARMKPPSHFSRSTRSEEHTSELQSRLHLVCRLLLEKKKKNNTPSASASDALLL